MIAHCMDQSICPTKNRMEGDISILDTLCGDREFLFTAQDFSRIRKIIYERAGISLSAAKKDMVYSRLARRLRINGCRKFSDYLDLLSDENEAEWEAFVNSLTTNLTSFFREPNHFPILIDHVANIRGLRSTKLWSCAASTGEEPYSMAIAMMELFDSTSPPVKILATDVDTNVLAIAQRGIYPIERVAMLSRTRLRKFFLRGEGKNEGYVKVRPELQQMVTFRQLNLLDSTWPLRGGFDAIFCRNVMIYFDKPTQRKILERLAPLMHSEGLLFAGHSESFLNTSDLFDNCGKTVYRLAAED